MGARPVTMTVKNFTSKLLILDSKKAEHGKFVTDPPSTIKAKGVWKCSANDGAMIGPKGEVCYKTTDDSFKEFNSDLN